MVSFACVLFPYACFYMECQDTFGASEGCKSTFKNLLFMLQVSWMGLNSI